MTKQTENMKERSACRFDQAAINSNVLVPVPSVDKAKLEPTNLLAIVLEITNDKTQYKLRTRSGILDGFFHRYFC